MKIKVTKKSVIESYRHIIRVGYCNLWYLLHYAEPKAYTCGKDGWNADIYDMGGGVAICTGYRTFGNVRPDYDLQAEYNEKAREFVSNAKIGDNPKEKIDELITEFIKKTIKED